MFSQTVERAAARKAVAATENELAKLGERRSAVERAMFDPKSATGSDAKLTMSELMKLRAEISAQIEAAEAIWLTLNEPVAVIA